VGLNPRGKMLRRTALMMGLGLSATVGAQDYPVAFETALKLQPALTFVESIGFGPTVYQFNLALPPALKTPLARLTIAIPEDSIPFGVNVPRLTDIVAFTPSNPKDTGPRYIAQVLATTVTLEGRTVVVNFTEPVGGGQFVTVEFREMRNPDSGGTYLFDINAYPFAPKPVKQFLGFARLTFRSPSGGS